MTARDDARQAHEIYPAGVLEIDADWCLNTYGKEGCGAGKGAPALDMMFVGKNPSLTPRVGSAVVTCIRAGDTATRVNEQGLIELAPANTLRINHNPVTLASRGAMYEQGRTNLALYSEQADTWWFIQWGSVNANATIGPRGLLTGAALITDNVTGQACQHGDWDKGILVTNVTYTVSRYMKAGTKSKAQMATLCWTAAWSSTFIASINIDLTAGVVYGNSNAISPFCEPAGNGWYRVGYTFLIPAGTDMTHHRSFNVRPLNDSWGTYYLGDGVSEEIYIDCAQHEAAATPSSYIPTTSAPVTRNADNIQCLDISSFHNASECTVFVEYEKSYFGGVAEYPRPFTFSDGTENEILAAFAVEPSALTYGYVRDGGVGQATINAGTTVAGETTKLVVRYKGNDFAVSLNGAPAVVDASGTMPTVDRLHLGRNSGNGNYLNGHILRFVVWPEGKTNAQMEALGEYGTEAIDAACHHTFSSCQDKTNYSRGTKTRRLITRGSSIPAGELLRPYLVQTAAHVPTAADPEQGLSRRGMFVLDYIDETDSDVDEDPYFATRSSPAQGTYWTRFLARNKYIAGRFARYRRGYVVHPWSWDTFQDELYIIESIKPPTNGKGQIVLKDPLKLADRKKTPIPTDGKLLAALPAYDDYGTAQGGSINTIQFRAEASAADDFYVGMAVKIVDQTGAGQERIITAYTGSTRTATVSPAFSVAPDSTSIYMVQQLGIAVPTGKGAQYDEYGYPTWVRLGEETIRIAGRTGDSLYWETTADRAQFDTALEDHKADDQVQLCKAFNGDTYTGVIRWFLNDAGLADTYIDLSKFSDLEGTWLGPDYLITRCLTEPRENNSYIKELVKLASGACWWDPVAQKVSLFLMVPAPPGAVPAEWTYDAAIVEGSLDVDPQDDLRITGSAVYYRPESATADESKHVSYLRGEGTVDQDASSPNAHGDKRIEIIYAAWFGDANQQAAANLSSRRVDQLTDAPKKVKLQLHPKDYDFKLGDQRDITSPAIVDETGAPKRTRIMITKISDRGAVVEVEGRTTTFARRYGFIAPNGTPDYPSDTDYGHISENSGLMPDGADGSLII